MNTGSSARPKTLYIKLGEGGIWEELSILSENNLRLGFVDLFRERSLDEARVLHSLLQADKESGHKIVLKHYSKKRKVGVPQRYLNQIRHFYTADEQTLWVTFFKRKLWWCYSTLPIYLDESNHKDNYLSKTRNTVDGWHSTDLQNRTLGFANLSGLVLRYQRFPSTIFQISDAATVDYLVRRINGDSSDEQARAEVAEVNFRDAIQSLINHLYDKDFEILIDLLFRETGWQRLSVLGEVEKDIDLELESPITSKRYAIQIKVEAGLEEFQRFRDSVKDERYEECYFVVQKPDEQLEAINDTNHVKLVRPKEIAQWVVKFGLSDWVMNKSI